MIQLRTLASALLCVATALTLPAQSTGKTKKTPKPKPVLFAVIKVDSETRIVKQAEVAQIKRQAAADHKAAIKAYNDAVKTARKNKAKVDMAKPKKPKFKMLKAGCKGKEVAEAFVAKLEAKERKKQEKKDKAEAARQRAKGKSKSKGKSKQ